MLTNNNLSEEIESLLSKNDLLGVISKLETESKKEIIKLFNDNKVILYKIIDCIINNVDEQFKRNTIDLLFTTLNNHLKYSEILNILKNSQSYQNTNLKNHDNSTETKFTIKSSIKLLSENNFNNIVCDLYKKIEQEEKQELKNNISYITFFSIISIISLTSILTYIITKELEQNVFYTLLGLTIPIVITSLLIIGFTKKTQFSLESSLKSYQLSDCSIENVNAQNNHISTNPSE